MRESAHQLLVGPEADRDRRQLAPLGDCGPCRRTRTRIRVRRQVRLIVLLLVAAAAWAAPSASADSIVFIRASNVWLANQDGSGQYQVTLDGTPSNPYESPSEADDGTILAIHQAPGGRNQLVRMTQSGGLLNAPANTPAPGPAGAIDAKINPAGTLAAYWFVTTVSDPVCAFCVNVASQALLSHSDRFTNYNEVGTPNTGITPSWITNDTVLLDNSNATQWYYKLGMVEAAEWFEESTVPSGDGQIKLFADSEVAPTGDRLALVRGDLGESLLIYKMNGLPPALPDPPQCAFTGPSGKFVGPTWSSNGRLLAWQENDGIWTDSVPANVNDCASYGAGALTIPGGTDPDLSPAANAPGPRPGCGNPGNPTACGGPGPGPGPVVVSVATLRSFLGSEARALKKLKIKGLLRKGKVSVSFSSPVAGTLTLALTAPGAAAKKKVTIASGRASFAKPGKKTVTLKLTGKGRKVLKHKRKLKGTLSATFKPSGGSSVSAKTSVSLKR
jgi:hypothetical protein